MFRYLAPFFSPLVILFTFWLFFKNQDGIWWFVAISCLSILFVGRILARSRFFNFKLLWLNLLVAYISQFLFLIILDSDALRYVLSFILSAAWLLVWHILKKYFRDIKDIQSREYLAVNKFFYYLSFWFLSASLYSLIIFVNFPALYALVVVFLASFFWSLEIIRTREDFNWYYAFFAAFLSAQLSFALYFAPLSFYVTGTIATLWFFFIIDNTANQLKYFKLYLGLFMLSVTLLLITSLR
ncbi:hypothetical protein KKH39_04765 [Patescibacteria group bacterium]|nr:hypothetical protein [Patescibacteria group bacterium]